MTSKWSAFRATAVRSGSSGEREATSESTTSAGTTSSSSPVTMTAGRVRRWRAGSASAQASGASSGVPPSRPRAASSLRPSRSTAPRSAAGASATTPVSQGAWSSEASQSARWPPARVPDDDDPVGQVGVLVHGLEAGEHGGAGARPAAARHPERGYSRLATWKPSRARASASGLDVGAVVLLAPEAAVHQRHGDAAGPAGAGSHTS